ncbi:hypothetical protein HELRODRAFT_68111 [Helobdella robusta]|uniref:Thyrotropin-releasing hormone receptor n=1 Tax=Helobdella robusta TaxID=6412 RepID=T1FZA4_HELRO|nr:hypothetical protein HELRODRAFT_68111 [Helobdella robusta]ESN96646.1 hypothetical protein HELRODRAFT_68111 [Helobdella robusta]
MNCSLTDHGLAISFVGTSIASLLFTVGIVGNICVILVVIKTRSLRRHPTNWYLASLAVSDCILLCTATLPSILEYRYSLGDWVMGDNGSCLAAVFLQYLGINVSSLSITAFSVERYVAICHPMKARIICTVSRAKKIIGMVWLFGAIYCAPWLFLTETRSKLLTFTYECSFKLKRHQYNIYYMSDLVIFYMVPLIGTSLLYCLIARALHFSTELNQDNPKANNNTNTNGNHRNYEYISMTEAITSTVALRNAVVKMLAMVVTAFAILWLPYRIFVVYNSFAKTPYTSLWFLTFCRLMVYCNSAINPILYSLMSAKFRIAFYQLFKCWG